MKFPDYHIHTLYSPDSQMEPDEAVRAAIGSGVTDICFTEHMDLGHHMEAFNNIPDFERREKVISQLRKKYSECNINIGKGIEVNTSGINRAGHVLPHPSIIRRYRELGGRIITIGLDAHNTQNAGIYIKDAINIISKAGFEEITLFKKREPSFIKITPSL